MKIAFLTSGRLPIPAVQGGAIENLVDILLEYNNRMKLHDITVYSIQPKTKIATSIDTDVNHYRFIDSTSWWARFRRRIFLLTKKKSFYYNYHIEFYLHEALKELQREQYDVIVLESRPGYALAVRRVSNAQIVVHLHNDWMSDTNDRKLLEARKHIDKVLTVSNYIKNRVDLIPDGLKSKTVYNGIDLDAFYNAKAFARNQFGFHNKDIVLVYSGRINPDKGVRELLEAFSMLADELPQLRLMIIGSRFFGETTTTDPFIEILRIKAEELKDRVVFTGFVPHAEIPSYLKMADIAVIPSIWEDPFPTTVIEAMASGLAIIASNSGGIPESLDDCGIMIEKENNVEKQLCNAIRLLSNDTSLRRVLGEKALKRSELFSKERYAQHFFENLKV